ncbi:hypothetical protein [Klebsiella variicola]|uniref:hypothetical protein n=2 Tax=Klebsiella pneumoniae complex TaxID=3390273 RepID=UPI002F91D897
MTTDITELALIKGQKVEAPYYLAECTECGKMYSSSKLIVSRNYFDGDADCYCPHCNADDADIADLGSGEQPAVMAWNYQQARIDVLVEALEKAQQVDEELCKLLPPGAEYMDPPDGGDVTPLEGVRRMVADYRQRIAELEDYAEAEAVGADKVAENAVYWMKRCKELESRTVNLPDGWQFEECEMEGCENGAIFSVGTGSRNIHLCDKCARESQNSRLKKSPLPKRLPFKMSAGIKVEAE